MNQSSIHTPSNQPRWGAWRGRLARCGNPLVAVLLALMLVCPALAQDAADNPADGSGKPALQAVTDGDGKQADAKPSDGAVPDADGKKTDETKPGDGTSGDAKPGDAKPGVPKPDDAKPTKNKPGNDSPTVVEPPSDPQPKPQPQPQPQPQPEPQPEPQAKPKYYVKSTEKAEVSTIGSLDPASEYKVEVDVSGYGGAIYKAWLTDHREDVDHKPVEGDTPQQALRRHAFIIQQAEKAGEGHVLPYMPQKLVVNGFEIPLGAVKWERKEMADAAVYVLTVYNAQDKPVLGVVRRVTIAKDTYLVRFEQRFQNYTDQPLKVQWIQNGQVDLRKDRGSYIGDRRNVITGYYNPTYDDRKKVWTTDAYFDRMPVRDPLAEAIEQLRYRRQIGELSGKEFETLFNQASTAVWDENADLPEGAEMAWLAFTNRYFAAVTMAELLPDADGSRRLPHLRALFPRVGLDLHGADPAREGSGVLAATLTSKVMELTAAGSDDAVANLNFSTYLGPRKKSLLAKQPYATAGLISLVRYNLGGPCACCTFQWLANLLLGILNFFESVTGDWAIAIILLVLVVRLCLHPITKKSQINMAKMGKQMQQLQPEIEKLKKKYPDKKDQPKLNQEMMALYREKGVNPLNMLGCLPMFLQMPIWIALYAMLYYAIELRHEPAFYGVFQAMGDWQFLANLAMPDRFMVFSEDSKGFTFFLSMDFSSLNVLPIVMGFFWFYQQKLLAPPPATEQAAQQQKIMRFMTLLFPFFLYSAPSGLTLYIMASSMAGVVDSLIVKKHIKREEEAGTLFQKKPPKPGGFRERLGKALEEKQKELQQRDQNLRGNQRGGGGGGNRRKRR